MNNSAHILVVDDDRDIRESLQEALATRGYGVTEAVDGLDAIEQLRAAHDLPDLILLDLMMPRMNGIEFRSEMVKDERLKNVPVLVLTADVRARSKVDGMGVEGYLVKPVGLGELFEWVAKIVRGATAAP
ncbi:MAG TPA: response regulator [Polyangiaceae bacterium]|nr:response regulator [Polyangiaceae bacterium]